MSLTNARSSPVKNLPSLTSCRFIAALCVVAYHFHGPWPDNPFEPIGRAGWMGVTFFFALSGFVLMWSFDPSEEKKHFYIRRLSRIYPLHILCLVVSVGAYCITGNPLAGYVGTKFGTLASLFLVHDWIPGHPHIRQAWDGVSWSLSCEFLFYLLAPFLFARWIMGNPVRHMMKLGGLWLLLLAVALTDGQSDMAPLADFLRMHPLPHLLEFSMGAVAAQIVRNHPELRVSKAGMFLWILPFIAYSYSAPGMSPYDTVFNILAIPGFIFLIVTMAQRDILGRQSFMNHPVLILLGESSFALYMTHALILGSPFSEHLSRTFSVIYNKPVFLTVCIAVYVISCVIVSVIVHKWIEIPARRWIIQNFARLKATKPLPSTPEILRSSHD